MEHSEILTTSQMSSKRILAIDWGYQHQSMSLLSDEAITVLEKDALNFDPQNLVMYAREYHVDQLVVTGPQGMFLPSQIKEIPVVKTPRLQAIQQGISFLAAAESSLILLAEVGLHLFYKGDESLYLGSLPYNFASLGLDHSLSVADEFGCEVPKPFQECVTYALPKIKNSDESETWMAYTIALGSKEFYARYQIKHCYLAGNFTADQQSLLQGFIDKATVEPLPYAMHIASTGLLVPYLAPHAETDS